MISKRKCLVWLLIMVMLLTSASITAFAAESTQVGDPEAAKMKRISEAVLEQYATQLINQYSGELEKMLKETVEDKTSSFTGNGLSCKWVNDLKLESPVKLNLDTGRVNATFGCDIEFSFLEEILTKVPVAVEKKVNEVIYEKTIVTVYDKVVEKVIDKVQVPYVVMVKKWKKKKFVKVPYFVPETRWKTVDVEKMVEKTVPRLVEKTIPKTVEKVITKMEDKLVPSFVKKTEIIHLEADLSVDLITSKDRLNFGIVVAKTPDINIRFNKAYAPYLEKSVQKLTDLIMKKKECFKGMEFWTTKEKPSGYDVLTNPLWTEILNAFIKDKCNNEYQIAPKEISLSDLLDKIPGSKFYINSSMLPEFLKQMGAPEKVNKYKILNAMNVKLPGITDADETEIVLSDLPNLLIENKVEKLKLDEILQGVLNMLKDSNYFKEQKVRINVKLQDIHSKVLNLKDGYVNFSAKPEVEIAFSDSIILKSEDEIAGDIGFGLYVNPENNSLWCKAEDFKITALNQDISKLVDLINGMVNESIAVKQKNTFYQIYRLKI